VVGHMRQIEMQEMELMAIYGMFLWRERTRTIYILNNKKNV
jgi:hypothetical protein